jgi:hypothetical protein
MEMVDMIMIKGSVFPLLNSTLCANYGWGKGKVTVSAARYPGR